MAVYYNKKRVSLRLRVISNGGRIIWATLHFDNTEFGFSIDSLVCKIIIVQLTDLVASDEFLACTLPLNDHRMYHDKVISRNAITIR